MSRPKTFEDLRAIIRQLEEDNTSRNKPNSDEGSVRKCYNCGRPGHVRNQCPKPDHFGLGKNAARKSNLPRNLELSG
ncbi:MAG: zinc finger CCHC domain-containing protein [Candidatus Hodgkinia cicadicola]